MPSNSQMRQNLITKGGTTDQCQRCWWDQSGEEIKTMLASAYS